MLQFKGAGIALGGSVSPLHGLGSLNTTEALLILSFSAMLVTLKMVMAARQTVCDFAATIGQIIELYR